MSIYRFGENSLIDEVTFRHTGGGGNLAYLHARDGADPKAIIGLKKFLIDHGLQLTPMQEDGKPVLEVRAFGKDEGRFIRTLAQDGAITDGISKTTAADDKIGLGEWIKKNTLSLSGLLYLAGDIGFLTNAIEQQHFERNKETPPLKRLQSFRVIKPQLLAGAIAYAFGSPFLVFFGRGDKSNLQLKYMSRNLVRDLEKQGIEIPPDAAAREVSRGHDTTFLKRLHSFVLRHPAEIANSMFGLAGGAIMWDHGREIKWGGLSDAVRQGKLLEFLKQSPSGENAHSPKTVLFDMGLGFMSVLAAVTSLFIEEEVPRPGDSKKGPFGSVVQWVKQHPLALASGLLGAATVGHAGGTYAEWRNVLLKEKAGERLNEKDLGIKKGLPGRLTFVATNVGAEIAMGISSKGHGAGVKSDDSLERSAYAVGADLVQRAAPEQREELLNKISKFYAHKKHLSNDQEVIREGIRKELTHLNENPWTGLARMPKENASTAEPQAGSSVWQGREAQRNAAVASPSLAV